MEAPCLFYPESFHLFRIFRSAAIGDFFLNGQHVPGGLQGAEFAISQPIVHRLRWLAIQTAQLDELSFSASLHRSYRNLTRVQIWNFRPNCQILTFSQSVLLQLSRSWLKLRNSTSWTFRRHDIKPASKFEFFGQNCQIWTISRSVLLRLSQLICSSNCAARRARLSGFQMAVLP